MLQEYIKRIVVAMQLVDKPSNETAIFALQLGLRNSNFVTSLIRNPAALLAKVMQKANQEMDVEEMLKGKFWKARARCNRIAKPIVEFKRGPD